MGCRFESQSVCIPLCHFLLSFVILIWFLSCQAYFHQHKFRDACDLTPSIRIHPTDPTKVISCIEFDTPTDKCSFWLFTIYGGLDAIDL